MMSSLVVHYDVCIPVYSVMPSISVMSSFPVHLIYDLYITTVCHHFVCTRPVMSSIPVHEICDVGCYVVYLVIGMHIILCEIVMFMFEILFTYMCTLCII